MEVTEEYLLNTSEELMDTDTTEEDLYESYELPIPEQFSIELDDAGHLHEWLVSQGIEFDGVTIVNRPLEEGGPPVHVLVFAKSDPRQALASYQRTPLRKEVLTQELANINLKTADIDELRQAVGIVKELIS
jgi:hypothetical protein